MQDDLGLLAWFSSKVPSLFSGLAGGVVGAWVDGKSTPREWGGYLLCGGLTAVYLGETAAHLIPFTDPISAGFIVGGSAIAIMRLLRGAINRWGGKLLANGNGGKGGT